MSMSPRDDDEQDDGCIRIPVRGARQTVEVYTDDLPADFNDVVDVLKAEIAPLDIWLRFAVEYYRQGSEAHFRGILNDIVESLTPETERLYADDRRAFDVGRIRILNALAADSVKQATKSTDRSTRDRQYAAALSHLTSADRVDNMSELTWVGKGVFYLCQGELDRAKYFFENARKQSPNFPATLGEAAVNFHNGNYKQALELYSDAIRMNPECSASVRVGFGLCCYKLGQTSRAQAAMVRALELDPKNVQALVGSAILEMSTPGSTPGSRDAARRRESAIHTMGMAYHVDDTNPTVLNHLANHFFWTWSTLKATLKIEEGSPKGTLSHDLTGDIRPGDLVRVGAEFSTVVVGNFFDGTTLELRDEYTGPSGDNIRIFTKNYRKVVELSNTAYENTTATEIKAESCFLKARVHHAKGSLSEAKLLYTEACHLWPQFPPAQYGMAQMLVYEGKIESAVKALEAVLAEIPDNQEALVLLGVLYANNKQRQPALSKFKRALELNPLLSDAWIAQAQMLQEGPTDHKLALSSYLKGLQGDGKVDKTTASGGAVVSRGGNQAAWANIAVLHEHVGNPSEAMSAYQLALGNKERERKHPEDNVDSDVVLRITDPANQLFWEWKDMAAVAKVVKGSRKIQTDTSIGGSLRKGTQIRVGEHYVTTAQGPEKNGAFEVADVAPGGLFEDDFLEGKLYKKVDKIRVTKDNVSMVFNMALLHEKQGHHEAAQELHKAVLAEHPTYVNSYLRLGIMARDSGQIHEASKWFKHALEVDSENPDIVAYMGNLHMRNSEWGQAQKKFEKILEMPGLRGDGYANLSLGNIYFSNLEDRTKYEKHLLHAANFFHEVLKKDESNAFAANGLGMVLAEKGTLDHAKDVFARVREASAEVLGDVWINLAHSYLAQNKHNEAIRLYQNCLKKFHGGRDPSLHIYLAHAYFDARQYSDCMRVLLKALHISPSNLQLWYNLALTRETFAVAVLQKEQKGEARTLAEVENAIEDLKGATKLFSWLKDCEPEAGNVHRHLPYDSSKAEKHAKFCLDNIERAAQHLNHEKMKAQQQQEVRERHQRALEKMVQQRKKEEEEERQRQEAYAVQRAERAKEKQASLSKLQESWSTQAQIALSKPSAKRGRGKKSTPQYESGSEVDDADDLSQNGENEEDGDGGVGAEGGAEGGDRYADADADDADANEAETSETQPPLPASNLKDIGLSSSSDDSDAMGDDAVGGGDDAMTMPEKRDSDDDIDDILGIDSTDVVDGTGQKRKWDDSSDEREEDDVASSSKRRAEEDST